MSPEELEEDSKFLEHLEEAMRGQEEEHHEKMKGGNLGQTAFVLTLEEKEEEKTLLNQGVRQSELEEMVLREEDLKLLHQQKLLLEEVSYGTVAGCFGLLIKPNLSQLAQNDYWLGVMTSARHFKTVCAMCRGIRWRGQSATLTRSTSCCATRTCACRCSSTWPTSSS